MLGPADNPPPLAPAVERSITEIAEHPGRRTGRKMLALHSRCPTGCVRSQLNLRNRARRVRADRNARTVRVQTATARAKYQGAGFLYLSRITNSHKQVDGAFVTLPRRKSHCTETPARTSRSAGVFFGSHKYQSRASTLEFSKRRTDSVHRVPNQDAKPAMKARCADEQADCAAHHLRARALASHRNQTVRHQMRMVQ
jgi:hypothetical protein